ncbi:MULTISPECIES: hypothetical protein [unclassified Salmonella]|uniref:hypothetical protein n=1 Tax=unclassified Salmonella TaxID=2614656 RepID=UPI00375489A3
MLKVDKEHPVKMEVKEQLESRVYKEIVEIKDLEDNRGMLAKLVQMENLERMEDRVHKGYQVSKDKQGE